ncbi:MAG: hypothetical protein R3E18_07190 [Sphingomonadaceae bacterium]
MAFLLIGLIGLNQLRLDREISDDFVPVEATITGFGTDKSDSSIPPGIAVSASTDDGLVGRRVVPASQVNGCQVGNRINAEKRGIQLKLTPSPCSTAN